MIRLRNIQPADKPHILQLMNNERISRFMSDRVPYPYTEKDADDFLDLVKKSEGDHFFAIVHDGQFAGGLGLHPQPLNHCRNLELGYWIGEPFQKRGFASEAVRLGLDFAFALPGVNKVFARVFEGNAGSEKVLLKNGFTLEGIMKKHVYKQGRFLDEKIFGKLKD